MRVVWARESEDLPAIYPATVGWWLRLLGTVCRRRSDVVLDVVGGTSWRSVMTREGELMTTSAPLSTRSGATVYGYPRQGRRRELKRAIEQYWAGVVDADALLEAAAGLRRERLHTLLDADIDEVPVNDFSLYDHVLDTAVLVGAVPARHVSAVREVSTPAGRLDRYFAMARGTAQVTPLEMTKWFDTNYHYLVPELGPAIEFDLDATKVLAEVAEARELLGPGSAVGVRPVVVGPLTFLRLAKPVDDAPTGFEPISLLDRLVPVYTALLATLAEHGVEWVQLDEPVAVTDLTDAERTALGTIYATLSALTGRPKILVGTYFGRLGEAAAVLVGAGVDGLAVDLTGPGQDDLATLVGLHGVADLRLVAGVVDGRNVWRTDLRAALGVLAELGQGASWVDVAPSCSLLHVPIDVEQETVRDAEVKSWLAFADQKLAEVVLLARGLREGAEAVADALDWSAEIQRSRAYSARVRRAEVQERLAGLEPVLRERRSPFAVRVAEQRQQLGLPLLPTTTIGSFPQTEEIRTARADVRAGRISAAQYDQRMRAEIDAVVALQEEIGLDVLVHGEPERNDMVQYFAEQLDGFASTTHGWVQSYGSRYVRPPILFGDVTRPAAMTVPWTRYAQSLTSRPVKGMVTGPVTILAWSFVRDDQPLGDTARQVALALRDEVADLEAAGVKVIQVDEPALRETLPLRAADQPAYLHWAVDAFRLATAGVADTTQVHTHMCYAEFDDIGPAIRELDADVISLEASRSRMEVVAELGSTGYPNEIGPGVWDIHSPRVPSVDAMVAALRLARHSFPDERIWVNPDCGLKTRGYAEVRPALANLVAAATQVRAEIRAG